MKDKKQIPSRTSRGLNWEKTHKLFASLSLFHPGYAYKWRKIVTVLSGEQTGELESQFAIYSRMQVHSFQLIARGKIAVLAKYWHENERCYNRRAHYIDIKIRVVNSEMHRRLQYEMPGKDKLQSPVLTFHKLRAVSYFSLCLQSSWVFSEIRTVQILREKGDSKQPIFFIENQQFNQSLHFVFIPWIWDGWSW